jgi:hypothetical protein
VKRSGTADLPLHGGRVPVWPAERRAPTRFSDPARFSFAHGGKDGHPFPAPLKTCDETLGFLRRSLQDARIGTQEKIDGFRRLDRLTRAVEQRLDAVADFEPVNTVCGRRASGSIGRSAERVSISSNVRA